VDADYSKASLTKFVDTAVDHGLLNANTAAGWTAAVSRILGDMADDEDVRTVDVPTAIKRYHNKHPGELKGTVLKEYERRLTRALGDFVKYTEDPTAYKGRGRGPSVDSEAGRPARKAKAKSQTITPQTGAITVTGAAPEVTPVPAKVGMTVDFNMRPDFLAQVVVPRDMKAAEAKRLCRLIMALAPDYDPEQHEGR
jgi:hypothetical protein